MIISIVFLTIKNQLTTLKKPFFSKLKNAYPSDEKIERTKEVIKLILKMEKN